MTPGERIFLVCRGLHRLLTHQVSEKTERPLLHLRALHAIEKEDVRTQAALAERLIIDAPAVSRLVDRLEEDGLLKRTAGENRRCTAVTVTAAAMPHIACLREGYESLDGTIASLLTEKEARTLELLLEKIHHGVQNPG